MSTNFWWSIRRGNGPWLDICRSSIIWICSVFLRRFKYHMYNTMKLKDSNPAERRKTITIQGASLSPWRVPTGIGLTNSKENKSNPCVELFIGTLNGLEKGLVGHWEGHGYHSWRVGGVGELQFANLKQMFHLEPSSSLMLTTMRTLLISEQLNKTTTA